MRGPRAMYRTTSEARHAAQRNHRSGHLMMKETTSYVSPGKKINRGQDRSATTDRPLPGRPCPTYHSFELFHHARPLSRDGALPPTTDRSIIRALYRYLLNTRDQAKTRSSLAQKCCPFPVMSAPHFLFFFGNLTSPCWLVGRVGRDELRWSQTVVRGGGLSSPFWRTLLPLPERFIRPY